MTRTPHFLTRNVNKHGSPINHQMSPHRPMTVASMSGFLLAVWSQRERTVVRMCQRRESPSACLQTVNTRHSLVLTCSWKEPKPTTGPGQPASRRSACRLRPSLTEPWMSCWREPLTSVILFNSCSSQTPYYTSGRWTPPRLATLCLI